MVLSSARELPKLYPWLSEILSAIAKHTTADLVMSADLDKIIYVADLIELLRASYSSIVRSRSFLCVTFLEAPSRELYLNAFSNVVESGKVLVSEVR